MRGSPGARRCSRRCSPPCARRSCSSPTVTRRSDSVLSPDLHDDPQVAGELVLVRPHPEPEAVAVAHLPLVERLGLLLARVVATAAHRRHGVVDLPVLVEVAVRVPELDAAAVLVVQVALAL